MKLRLILISTFISLLPVFTVLLYFLFYIINMDLNFSKLQIQSELDTIHELMVEFIKERKDSVNLWSELTLPKVSLEFKRPEKLNEYLTNTVKKYPYIKEIYIFDSNLNFFAKSSSNIKLDSFFDFAEQTIEFKKNIKKCLDNKKMMLFIDSEPTFELFITSTIVNNNLKPIGYIGVSLKHDIFDNYLTITKRKLSRFKSLNVKFFNFKSLNANYFEYCSKSKKFELNEPSICLRVIKDELSINIYNYIFFLIITIIILIAIYTLTFNKVIKWITKPFEILLHVFKSISTTKSFKINFYSNLPELINLEVEANKVLKEIIDLREKQNELLKIQTMQEVAKQISHDIRSPLTALNMMLGSMTQLPEQQRIIMRSAITRINDIANDLLNKGKQIQKENTSQNIFSSNINSEKIQLSSQLLSPLVETIVSEKRIQFRENQNIEIVADIEKGYGLFANVNITELARVISNLLNNAIEAMPEAKGQVIVGIRGYSNFISIIVQDNGKGIPQHIINKLGEQGVTHGKEGTSSGSGLGIYHAKKTIESFGGKFDIGSREGVGTTISMHFPKTQAPKWFVEKLLLRPHQQIISLDDDLSIHGIWKGRFESKKLYELGIEHLTFTSGEEFKKWFSNTKTANSERLYLVDYELLNQKQTGLEIIEALGISSHSILVTSRYDEDKIQQKCEQLEVKLIPKAMACLVPIEIEKPKEKYTLCLLDDDFLTRDTWKLVFQAQNKSMLYFSNPEDFFKKANELDFEIPIYIDSNLGNGIKGEDVAKKIYEMGFKNIWLCTGYQASEFPPMPWIKGIVGKEPPNNI